MEILDIEAEDRIRHPYFIFCKLDNIPWYQRISIDASLVSAQNTHMVSITEFQQYIDSIRDMEYKNTLGILPPGILPYAKKLYFNNQRIRWAFKKLLYIYRNYKSSKLIFNTECLEGNPIVYNPRNPSRRILCLWDNSSKRSYLFSIGDILGIFRACVLGNEIHTPKNPYTNIPFTRAQLCKIHMFIQFNMDRLRIEDNPILTYTRWVSVELTYDHITHTCNRYGSMCVLPPEEPMIANLLWDSIMVAQHLKQDKQELAVELRDEFFKQVYHEFLTNLKMVPTTKMGHFVRTRILSYHMEHSGEVLRQWHFANRHRYVIRYRPTGNHRDSE